MITSTKPGLTKAQVATYWRSFTAAATAQGIPADERDAYRHTVMLDACGCDSIKQLNRVDDFDKVMYRFALDAGDYGLAAHYTIGDARRVGRLVELCAHQLMQCQGTEPKHAQEYVAGIIEQANYLVRRDGPVTWLDLSPTETHSLFQMLDTARRRLLERAGWIKNLKFKAGAKYALRSDGTIVQTADKQPPAEYFKVNILA